MSDYAPGEVKRKAGSVLTRVGAAVGVLGAIAMLIRLKVVLGPGMEQVLFYKGLFASSAVLLLLGAIYGRQGRDEQKEAKTISSRPSDSLSTSSRDAGALPAHYSTSEPESRERQYERTDRESH